MGRHSTRAHRPAHSVHGQLYWTVVMWPLTLQQRLPRSVDGRTGRHLADPEVDSSGGPVIVPHRVAGTDSAPADIWGHEEEGSVKPTWEDRSAFAR
jgi:hypothetical protein